MIRSGCKRSLCLFASRGLEEHPRRFAVEHPLDAGRQLLHLGSVRTNSNLSKPGVSNPGLTACLDLKIRRKFKAGGSDPCFQIDTSETRGQTVWGGPLSPGVSSPLGKQHRPPSMPNPRISGFFAAARPGWRGRRSSAASPRAAALSPSAPSPAAGFSTSASPTCRITTADLAANRHADTPAAFRSSCALCTHACVRTRKHVHAPERHAFIHTYMSCMQDPAICNPFVAHPQDHCETVTFAAD